MDSETAFVIAIIVVFIVIGIFVFIYACCVTEEKLKNATKRKASEKKATTPAPTAQPAPSAAPVAPSTANVLKRPAQAAPPLQTPSGSGRKQNPEILLTVQSAANQGALPAYLFPPPSAEELTPKQTPTNAQAQANGKNHIALAVAPPRRESLPKAGGSAYTVHL